MNNNKEIEFRTIVTKQQYDDLLEEFKLSNNIFPQTNHYFDTPNADLLNQETVLRIRQKGNNFKLTKKTRALEGADETHVFLSKEKAIEMLEKGFDANIIGINMFVNKVSELTTFRASTHYKNGIIFFDRSEYYGHVDYEVEFEVDEINQGKKDFVDFLNAHNITYQEPTRKSKRAFQNRNL